MASTMQLEFSQAMSDFKTMFPDMDRDVIEAVLRANQGAVDATIDQLLQMSTDNQNEKLRNELDGNASPQRSLINMNDSDTLDAHTKQLVTTGQLIDVADGIDERSDKTSAAPAAVANAALLNLNAGLTGVAGSPSHSTGASPKIRPPLQLQTSKISQGNTPKKTARCQMQNARWNPPMLLPLPSNFLRIIPINMPPNTVPLPHDGSREFDLPDEQFAMMLQNEEFMNQLRWNQEFMNALDREQCAKGKAEDDAAFKERLKNMGKLSRKKFLQIARVFTWQRNKKVTTAKQIDSLPLKEEPSDDEEHHHHHQRPHEEHAQNQHSHQTNIESQTLQHQQQQHQPEMMDGLPLWIAAVVTSSHYKCCL